MTSSQAGAATVTSPDATLRRSLVAVAAKRALQVAGRWLPSGANRRLYDTAFSVYRLWCRETYRVKGTLLALSGDSRAGARARRIVSVMPYSLVGWRGLEVTHDGVVALNERRVAGALVECGVARGGASALMALTTMAMGVERHVWLFDSFEGLPEPTVEDFGHGSSEQTGDHLRPLPKGSCLGTEEDVRALLFSRLHLDLETIHLVKGWFDQTLSPTAARIGAIALLRIDGDWYESVKCCLETLYDAVSDGGLVIIDDYQTCHGARRAVDEFLGNRGASPRMSFDGRGGCLFAKTDMTPGHPGGSR